MHPSMHLFKRNVWVDTHDQLQRSLQQRCKDQWTIICVMCGQIFMTSFMQPAAKMQAASLNNSTHTNTHTRAPDKGKVVHTCKMTPGKSSVGTVVSQSRKS
eukprot:scaffold67144_cov18-Tisochrysis_lutea.AAC.1